MRWQYVLNVIGVLTLVTGLTMLVPLGVGFFTAMRASTLCWPRSVWRSPLA